MSVLLEFAMFPTDKSGSVSEYVSKVVDLVRNSGFEYKLTAMATIVETDTLPQALDIVQRSYEVLEPHTTRVYSVVKMDIRKNVKDRITGKIKSVEAKIGEVKK